MAVFSYHERNAETKPQDQQIWRGYLLQGITPDDRKSGG